MTPEDERRLEDSMAGMTPEERRQARMWFDTLREWLTVRGFLTAWLLIAALMAVSGTVPNLGYISTAEGSESFVSQLPMLLALAFGGSLAIIGVGWGTAFVGGHIVLHFRKKRLKTRRE